MREKERTLIISFASTTQAMRMEASSREFQKPGRLIPVPDEISAGCGLAWSVSPEYREEMEAFVKDQEIKGKL